jgi:hypothetical protein
MVSFDITINLIKKLLTKYSSTTIADAMYLQWVPLYWDQDKLITNILIKNLFCKYNATIYNGHRLTETL